MRSSRGRSIVPPSALSSPAMMRSSVDFPLPLRPDERDAVARPDEPLGVTEEASGPRSTSRGC